MADRSITLLELNLPDQMSFSAGDREFSFGSGGESAKSRRSAGSEEASSGSGRKLLTAVLVVATVVLATKLLQGRGLGAAKELDELGVKPKISR